MFILLGLTLVLCGISFMIGGIRQRKFYLNIAREKNENYGKTVGKTVGYVHTADSHIYNPITSPVVLYQVDGQSYRGENTILETGSGLPNGTEMYVWYEKDHSENCVLESDLDTPKKRIWFGVIFMMMGWIVTFCQFL